MYKNRHLPHSKLPLMMMRYHEISNLNVDGKCGSLIYVEDLQKISFSLEIQVMYFEEETKYGVKIVFNH